MSKGPARCIRLRAVVAYPAISLALVVSIAFALTPFGPAQGLALAAMPTPTPTSAATAAPTTAAPSTAATSAHTAAAPSAPGPVPNPVPGPVPNLTPSPGGASVDHHVLARIEGATFQAQYLLADAPVLDASQFQTFRVRFQIHNAGTAPITATPRLEYRPEGAAGFVVVPEKPQPGVALSVSREWVPRLDSAGGTMQGPLGEDIAAADLKTPSTAGVAAVGHHSMGANPDAPITLPAGSYTEQEFTVRLTMDAKYLTGYELQITGGGTALTGTQVARIVLGPPPGLQLSPGQRQGAQVDDPTAKANAAGVVYPLQSAPANTSGTTSVSTVAAVSPPSAARFPLASGSLSAATAAQSVTVAVVSAGTGSPHDMAAAQCGTCHRGHTATASGLLAKDQQSTLCFSCHDGATAGAPNVKGQYALARPANDPVKREYYSHDALISSPAPTQSGLDAFRGVTNRRSECADCHNSHRAKSTDSTQKADGWDASGRLAGVSGVSVVNGAPGSSPKYTLLSGLDTDFVPANLVTREYQLCFKCHSGFTTLTKNDGLKESQFALDKGVEFNPANPSFHPVEAAGTNQTTKMGQNLASPSPYKLWNFNTGSTIRCLNCHASGTTPTAPAPPTDASSASGALPPHTSSNRGILLRNYQDRVLKSTSAAYSAGDFALCFVCHGEEPFARGSSSATTNFPLHSYHLNFLTTRGFGGTDIDTPGAGQGNAICAECHFRIHSTTNKSGTQTIPGSRLLNFAPNVKPLGGKVLFTKEGSGGSCTLTCHGYSHFAYEY